MMSSPSCQSCHPVQIRSLACERSAEQTRRARVAVLISGRGSNLLALLEAIERDEIPAEIVLVVSNRAEAGGLAHARSRAIPTLIGRPIALPEAGGAAAADPRGADGRRR